MPGTLEGCLVKLCDTMSYIGKDIEDAVQLGILSRNEVPRTLLGTNNREILGYLSADIIRHSYEKDYIAISEEAYEALKILRHFNFEHIYNHPKLKVESSKIKLSYRILFDRLLEDYVVNAESSFVWKSFVHNKNEEYLQTSPVQVIIDYIAGMTDNFFIRTLEKLIIPKKIEIL